MLEQLIERELAYYKISLKDSRRIGESIMRLSDFYIENPDSPTPWKESWAQIAYLSYFLPLNYWRAQHVIQRGLAVGFFKNIDRIIDFGSGIGSAGLALSEHFPIQESLFIEHAQEAQKIHQRLIENKGQWVTNYPTNKKVSPKTLASFSYSLTEIQNFPQWALDCDQIMIIEPATEQDGRQLLQLRQKLIDQGFHIWAPCTHQKKCPLLTQTKTDWCHDRLVLKKPEWLAQIEKHIAMRNNTLTMSYILASKTPAPTYSEIEGRTTGDFLKEKGKSRQMICRNEDREFLTWLKKHGEAQEIPRGSLVKLNAFDKVSNELRPTETVLIQ